ncbi:unnamed protein product [Lasius platythorax]|uniref:Uncharacterized protein n=1 Tax=Lasius platythorax TaxID=488582 RepID=A0AAV2P2D0_9HYME
MWILRMKRSRDHPTALKQWQWWLQTLAKRSETIGAHKSIDKERISAVNQSEVISVRHHRSTQQRGRSLSSTASSSILDTIEMYLPTSIYRLDLSSAERSIL